MSRDPDKRTETEDPSYRVYGGSGAGRSKPKRSSQSPRSARSGGGSEDRPRAGSRPGSGADSPPDFGLGGPSSRGGAGSRGGGGASRGGAGRGDGSDVPYTKYRSAPRGPMARLRGDDDAVLGLAEQARGDGGRKVEHGPWITNPFRGPFSWKKALKIVIGLLVFWVGLSLILFLISAEKDKGNLPKGATSALHSSGPMLTSANTVLVLGLDNRPTTGVDSKEGGGAETSETNARTDTIMLWRVGGGVSRRLSIPRDTLVNIPGYGQSKINAAWTYGGPKLAIQTIEKFTGISVNHVIVVDLANFPKFINDVGGVNIKTDKVCSSISGGAANGGFTLNLSAGTHHLNGEQAMILARTRENSCNPAENDLTREKRQQQILNSIKSQLLSVHSFFHLPWIAWDAPGVVQTDMGGLTMLQLFLASEIGGSAPPQTLNETGGYVGGQDVLMPNQTNVTAQVSKLMTGH